MLCTGDFRYSPALHDHLSAKRVDKVFLDNTFLYPLCTFPPRNAAMAKLIEDLRAYPKNVDVHVALDNVGKEVVLIGLARAFNVRIYADPERMEGRSKQTTPLSNQESARGH